MSDIYILSPDPNGVCCECSDRPNVCDTCTPNPCTCTIALNDFIIPATNPFIPAGSDSYTGVQTLIASQFGSCGAFTYDYYHFPPSLVTHPVSLVDGTLSVAFTTTSTITSYSMLTAVEINAHAGATLNLSFTATFPAFLFSKTLQFWIYACDGTTELYSGFSPVSPFSDSFVIPSDGSYRIKWEADAIQIDLPGTAFSFAASMTLSTSDGLMTINPQTTIWKELVTPFTPHKIEICPRFYIPLPWELPYYTNVVEAQSALDNYTKSCIGYSNSATTFTAAGTSTLTLNGSCSGSPGLGFPVYFTMVGCVNLSAAGTIHVIYNVTADTPSVPGIGSVSIAIYDSDGVIFSFTPVYWPNNSGTLDLAITLPGRYYVSCLGQGGTYAGVLITTTASFVISSPDTTMSINTITALYNNPGLCPTLLACTP